MIALLRSLPASLADCELTCIERLPIDGEAARAEQAALRRALEEAGIAVIELPADEACPDCAFVEDLVVVLDERRILTNPGAPSRRPERAAVADLLGTLGPWTSLPEGLRLDGGDVLQIADRIFVGRSSRSDPAAARWLGEQAGRPVVPVELRGVLHLKTGATALDDRTILAAPGAVDEAAFEGLEILHTPPGEARAANVLRLPDRLLADAGAPGTLALLRDRGHQVVPLPIDHIARAEAGLTCLCVLLPGSP